MAQPFQIFDPTIAVASHVDVNVNEGCGLRLWNESNVTIQFETTYGDFFYLPAWTEDVFIIHYKVTQLDWEQFFIIQGAEPSDSRVYGIIYTKDETAELNWSGSRPIQRWLNIAGGEINLSTMTNDYLTNTGNPTGTRIVTIKNTNPLLDNVILTNDGYLQLSGNDAIPLITIDSGTGVPVPVSFGKPGKTTVNSGGFQTDTLTSLGAVIGSNLPAGTSFSGAFALTIPASGTAALVGRDNAFSVLETFNAGIAVIGGITASTTIAATGAISGSNIPAGASITGNGTIATGGFTLTIPATGTAALRAIDNGFTAIQTITLTDTATSTRPALITLNHRTSGVPIAGYGLQLLLRGDTDNNTLASFGQFNFSWIVPTNGAQTARIQAFVMDAAGPREGWRIDASGTAPMIGFLGANAVVRQTGGALTAGAAYTATEQGMINSVWTALRNYGLLT